MATSNNTGTLCEGSPAAGGTTRSTQTFTAPPIGSTGVIMGVIRARSSSSAAPSGFTPSGAMNTPQLLAANCISLPVIEASISARSLRVWIPDAGTETEKLRRLELYTPCSSINGSHLQE